MTAATLTSLRNRTAVVGPTTTYYVTDADKRGVWMLDPTDDQTPDNGVTCVVTKRGQRLKHQDRENKPLDPLWFGMVPNSPSSASKNSRILYQDMQGFSPYPDILLDWREYHIGAAPVQLIDHEPCALNLTNFQGALRGPAGKGATLIGETGCTIMQIVRTSGECDPYLEHLNLVHDGGRNSVPNYQQNYTPLENGGRSYAGHEYDWNTNWGDYKINGINLWGVARGHNISISGVPGHGVCHFAVTGNNPWPGPKMPIAGTYQEFNGDRLIQLDKPSMMDLFNQGEPYASVTIGDRTFLARNKSIANQSVVISYAGENPQKLGSRFEGYAQQAGRPMNADSCCFTGITRISGVGGMGYFSTSNEANLALFEKLEVRNSGGPAAMDSSLHKNTLGNCHFTGTGEHFNDFTQNPPVLRMPSYSNRGDQNVGPVLLNVYDEGGQAAPADLSPRALVLGGQWHNGLTGGHGILDRKFFGCYVGDYNGMHVEFADDGLQFWNGPKHLATLSYAEWAAKLAG